MKKWKQRLLLAVWVLLVAGMSLAVWAFSIEPARLVVKHVTLPWTPAAGRGLRIALLSDVHVGSPHVDLARLRSIVETINRESPDLILIAGDLVVGTRDGGTTPPEAMTPELKELRARYGVAAVLGNHDWSFNVERVRAALREGGVMVLINDAVQIQTPTGPVWLAGVGDLWTGLADLDGTLRKVSTTDPVILMTHNPDVFAASPARVELVLAGHTHGGQVRFPLIGAPIVPSEYGQRYAAGLIEENGRRMFVTTGVGTSILPVRFGVPPEIVILTLGAQ